MKQVSLEVGDSSDLRLKALAHQWGVSTGRVVDLLCQSIDRESMARLAIQAMSGTLVRTEDGIARMPARKALKSGN